MGIYDIFKKDQDQPIWMEAVHGLEETRRRIMQLSDKSQGEYLVFDASRGRFIDIGLLRNS
jgi:hypothetical protein